MINVALRYFFLVSIIPIAWLADESVDTILVQSENRLDLLAWVKEYYLDVLLLALSELGNFNWGQKHRTWDATEVDRFSTIYSSKCIRIRMGNWFAKLTYTRFTRLRGFELVFHPSKIWKIASKFPIFVECVNRTVRLEGSNFESIELLLSSDRSRSWGRTTRCGMIPRESPDHCFLRRIKPRSLLFTEVYRNWTRRHRTYMRSCPSPILIHIPLNWTNKLLEFNQVNCVDTLSLVFWIAVVGINKNWETQSYQNGYDIEQLMKKAHR